MSWFGLVVGIVIGLALVYTVIPDFLLHRLGIGVDKSHYAPGVVLTFDDGPDPVYTLPILDALDEYGSSAVFFVTGANAAKYPELTKEIIKRGHTIGAHSQNHSYSWFESPLKTWREWEHCVHIIEGLSGQDVEWVRPPWGTFNLATWLWIKLHKKRAVLWDLEGHDWQPQRTADQIAARVLKGVKEGSIIVLHDAGSNGASRDNTVKAVSIICQKVLEREKLPLVKLQFPPWPWWRRLSFKLWRTWERIFAWVYQVQSINHTNCFRLSKTIYHGPDLYNATGELVAKAGDEVGELHLDSGRMQSDQKDSQQSGIRLLRLARKSLPELAQYIEKHPGYQDIKLFMGQTLIHYGVKSLGFHVADLPRSGFYRAIGLMQRIIVRIYNPYRKSRVEQKSDWQPKLVWLSRDELFERWLPPKGKEPPAM